MELVEFGPDQVDALTAYVEVCQEAAALDAPWARRLTLHAQEMVLRHGFDGETGRHFLLRSGTDVVGALELFAGEYDNLDLAWIELTIRPSYRRRGHGRAALGLALAECARLGRPLVTLELVENDATRAFARDAGFAENSVGARRLLDLDGSAAQRAGFAALLEQAQPHALDYELVRVTGRTPEELLAAVVAVTEAINDAPTDDLEYEDEKFDVDRVRAYEAAQEANGFRFYRLLARHRSTGEIAGHSVVAVDAEQPAWAEQHDTSVLPSHRGHRLGLVLKTSMLAWLAETEPGLRHIETHNAVSNDPMIAVNEQLGMRLADRLVVCQRRTGA